MNQVRDLHDPDKKVNKKKNTYKITTTIKTAKTNNNNKNTKKHRNCKKIKLDLT